MTLNDDELDRYARHLVLREVGGAGQAKLRDSAVLIVGIGGLGAPALQYLAAAGVGKITIIDDDIVSASNLQRQTIYRTDQIGQPKVEAARNFVSMLNPHVAVTALKGRIDAQNVDSLTKNHELILDCCDNFATRYLLAAASFRAKVPLVSAAIRGFDGQLSVWHPDGHSADRPCYHCFNPVRDPETLGDDDCAATGILGPVAGVLGTLQALEAMRTLISFGPDGALIGRMLLMDMLSGRQRLVKVSRDPHCTLCGDGGTAADA
ncbi:MAG: molybdopterin-synthase adenylyltransferase MoeB [Alphaproteobacteria bacterium]